MVSIACRQFENIRKMAVNASDTALDALDINEKLECRPSLGHISVLTNGSWRVQG